MNQPNITFRLADDTDAKELLTSFSAMLDFAGRWRDDVENSSIPHTLEEELHKLEKLLRRHPRLSGQEICHAQLRNTQFTLESIANALQLGEKERAQSLVRFQLPCFLQELREECYFHGWVEPNPEIHRAYYDTEFVPHHQNQAVAQKRTACQVSIFVPAKDNLPYTRRCVESILEETDRSDISYELILINHGSRDDTQDYFQSVQGAKVLHFRENVRMIMFSSALRVAEGRYLAFVSNDTVVTKDWLKLLMRCLKSHPDIVSVTPTTPNVSNFQGTAEGYDSLEELADFAQKFNHSDPCKWEWRARIMPVIALYDVEKLNHIGFTDRYFHTMEFWDDDFSLRARRAGYRQMLCRDVYCHHHGSLTGKDAQQQENTLAIGRQLFVNKHGVDPWSNGAYYDYSGIQLLTSAPPPKGQPAVLLGIDCGFGDTLLQMGNLLRNRNIESELHAVTTQPEYAPDLAAICSCFYAAESEEQLLENLEEKCLQEQYDAIYLGLPLELYGEWNRLLNLLHRCLKPKGALLFSLSNMASFANIQCIAAQCFPPGRERICYLNPDTLTRRQQEAFQQVTTQPVRGWTDARLLESALPLCRWVMNKEDSMERLDTVSYQYLCYGKNIVGH